MSKRFAWPPKSHKKTDENHFWMPYDMMSIRGETWIWLACYCGLFKTVKGKKVEEK